MTTTPSAPATAFAFPISLELTGRRCVVVGGGPMAAEKAEALRLAGADVHELAAGAFAVDHLDGTFLVVVSGEDDTDSARVFAEAERRGVLVNALDDIPHCHFAFPSIVRRGDLRVAISTNGKAPGVARRLRIELEEQLPAGLGPLVEAYAEARRAALPRRVPFGRWAAAWQAALADLPALLERCEAGRSDEVRDHILALVTAANDPGDSEHADAAGVVD